MTYRTNLPLDGPAWQTLHCEYLAAVRTQTAKLRGALAHEVGDRFDAFVRACCDGLLVVSSHFLPGGLHYVVAVRVSDGMAPLAVVPAARLGLDDLDTEAAELDTNLRRGQR